MTLHNPGTLEKTAQLILAEYDAQGSQISMRVLQSADVASGTDVTLNLEAGDFSADAETAALLVLERGNLSAPLPCPDPDTTGKRRSITMKPFMQLHKGDII